MGAKIGNLGADFIAEARALCRFSKTTASVSPGKVTSDMQSIRVEDRELLNNRRKNVVESQCLRFIGGD